MSAPSLSSEDLKQFTGSENWYRHDLVRSILYTDGAKYLAERGSAYWLLDEIATTQLIAKVATEPFQVWTLKLRPDHGASLRCEDGNKNQVFHKLIPFTDFPLDEITLWLTDNTILLPSEY